MKATLVGHACWVLQTAGGTVITDPVFFDPFEQGAVTSCPKRAVAIDQLPELDAVYLSHRHIDHFDFPSLDRLDRALPIWLPEDPLMAAGLADLGFSDLRFLAPFEAQRLGDLEVIPVPSYSDELVEYGAIFKDPSGSIFDQVDCPLTPESMQRIRALVPELDVHLSMYASQNFAFFESRTDDVAAVYANNVFTALFVGARLVVPGAAGFRFADEVGWLNKHLFPISSERFMDDLRRLDPEAQTTDILPGDTISVQDGTITMRRADSPFARTVQDDRHELDFDASAPIPPLTDPNDSGFEPDFLRRFAQGFVQNALSPWLAQLGPDDDEVASTYMHHGARYELEIVYPEGDPDRWVFAFRTDGVDVHAGADAPPGDVIRRIAASALADVAAGRKSAFFARTRSRRSALVIAMGLEEGRLAFDEVRLDDLLMHFVVALRRQHVGDEQALREYLGLYPPAGLIRG